jgi:hypothetical protein
VEGNGYEIVDRTCPEIDDGVTRQMYINHANRILVTFKLLVDWLVGHRFHSPLYASDHHPYSIPYQYKNGSKYHQRHPFCCQ